MVEVAVESDVGRVEAVAASRRRWTVVLLPTCAVAASLITFPAATAWMVIAWIAWYLVRFARDRVAWPCLAACIAIVLIKRVPIFPGLALCLVLMGALMLVDLWRPRRMANDGWEFFTVMVAALAMSWLFMAIDWRASARRDQPSAFTTGRPIACIGDSLTSGISAKRGYPAELAKLVGVPVIDLSREGCTSGDAIRELLPAALKAKPQAVIVELGGHDFLFDHPQKPLETNLRKIIQSSRDAGAEVILVEIPRGFVSDRFGGIERRLAREYDLELLSDSVIRRFVLWSPAAPPGMWFARSAHLSDDGLHPNEKGDKLLAREALQRLFGDAVLRRGN